MRINGIIDVSVNHKTDSLKLFLFMVIVFAFTGISGCWGGDDPGMMYFSPDGSTIAYTYVKRIDLPLPPEMPTLYSTVYLQWCPVAQLKSYRSMKIDSYGKSYGSFVQGEFRLLFSPDSRHIAVKSPRHLEIIELETQKRLQLTGQDERVTSMGWRSNKEMIYVIHKETKSKQHGSENTRQIFRHPVGDSTGKRVLLFEQTGYFGNEHDFVSPTGEYVLFLSQDYSDRAFYLLNVQTEKVRPISDKKAQCQGVSWKPDGSCVFYLSGTQAMLLYPKEGRIKDLSGDYDNSFRRDITYSPSVDELWTPGGEYIVINSSITGGCLVCPDPWRVVPTGKLMVKYVEEKENRKVYHKAWEKSLDSYPWLYVQPYQGWVRLWFQMVLGEKSSVPWQPIDLEARNYLVDYEGKQFLPMRPSHSPGGAWTLTPDGQKIVYFNNSIFLDEKSVFLPKDTQQAAP